MLPRGALWHCSQAPSHHQWGISYGAKLPRACRLKHSSVQKQPGDHWKFFDHRHLFLVILLSDRKFTHILFQAAERTTLTPSASRTPFIRGSQSIPSSISYSGKFSLWFPAKFLLLTGANWLNRRKQQRHFKYKSGPEDQGNRHLLKMSF